MRPLSPRTQDALIAGVVTALLVIEVLTSPVVHGPVVLNVLALAPAGVALFWRRRHPLVPMVVLGVGYSISALLLTDIERLSMTIIPLIFAGYAVGRHRAGLRLPTLVFAITIAIVNLGDPKAVVDDWFFPFVIFGATAATGRALRTRTLVAAELAERTERLAVEQDLRAAEAAHEERRRIARELHDVVAHTLSVMVVQAGAARRTVGRDAEAAEASLVTVEATGRAALGELRRLLGFVGEGSGGQQGPLLDPQPTTADLAALARRAGAAGLPTAFAVEGEHDPRRPLPAGAEVAVYRIAQEALTNAIKHAGPGATASLTLRWRPEALEVEVCDDGGEQRSADVAQPLPPGGHGLVGMRERVTLYRGALEAGPVAGGGFRVLARLPREAALVTA